MPLCLSEDARHLYAVLLRGLSECWCDVHVYVHPLNAHSHPLASFTLTQAFGLQALKRRSLGLGKR
jgi:hypothetical protein